MSEPGRGRDATAPLLEVRELTVHHGQLRALDRISLRVFPGEVYAIIGANGAGKSTLLRTIAGLHHPTGGSIMLDGQDVTRVRPERRAARGIVLVPEGRRLFGSLSVEENLQVGATHARKGTWTIERVYELFDWMRERRSQRTAQLSGGEQQAVAIGRALVEQDVSQALRVASRLQCLLEGHTTLEASPSDITADQVEAAYFGLKVQPGPAPAAGER